MAEYAEYIGREALKERFTKRLDWLRRDIHDEYSGALYDSCETDMELIDEIPAAAVAPGVHGRCPICSGQKILTQDCYNDYSVEVDAESGEMSVWQGDACLTVISIDYCPNCGAKMDGGVE